jgi:hypothetical protein
MQRAAATDAFSPIVSGLVPAATGSLPAADIPRDLGRTFVVMKDACAPITVRGRHCGGLRLADKAECPIAEKRRSDGERGSPRRSDTSC